MPGLLVLVALKEAQAGEELAGVEVMKMENVLRAGAVAMIAAETGQSLSVDQVILEFE